MMPPQNAVIDPLIQEFCRLPYPTLDGPIPACPGITRGLYGCPPHAPEVGETMQLLLRAGSLLVLQFPGREGHAPQGEIHTFVARVSEALDDQGHSVLETYASGPCKVCPKGCGPAEECRFPHRRLFAFEACGFWVNSICSAAATYPILNGGPKQVRWIKDWRLPSQDTDAVAYTAGVLLA